MADPAIAVTLEDGSDAALLVVCASNGIIAEDANGVSYPVLASGSPCASGGTGETIYGSVLTIIDGCTCGDVLTWAVGDGYPLQVTVTNEDGAAIDITGWNMQMTVGTLVTDSVPITDGVNGVFTVDIPKDTLTAGYYNYSFKHVTADTTRTISGGRMQVS